jgi:Zn-finger nucleic acid-binding protein
MKMIATKCPHCGASLNVDVEKKQAICEFCRSSFIIDDEVQHVQYDNAEDAGYKFEKGRQRAQAEAQNYNNTYNQHSSKQFKKKRRTWLWVLGWIFIFPLPLTILMIRNKKLSKWLRIGIIAVAWIVYFLIAFSGNNTDNKKTGQTENNDILSYENTNDLQASENSTSLDGLSGETIINEFVDNYNKVAPDKMSYLNNFDVQDKTNGHYRTEFRLNAYTDAVGKTYEIDANEIDIVSSQDLLGEINIRIYGNNLSLEQCIDLIKYASPLLDANTDDDIINEAIRYVSENRGANGYYYGDLGLVITNDDSQGYNLMIKTD